MFGKVNPKTENKHFNTRPLSQAWVFIEMTFDHGCDLYEVKETVK
jgi:hypothetical protein